MQRPLSRKRVPVPFDRNGRRAANFAFWPALADHPPSSDISAGGTHWTKREKRLARDLGRVKWGDEGYAKEELVAELGAAFLCADLGLTPEVRDDHAACIASWLEVPRGDKRFVFSAASHAQRAADYLHALQGNATKEVQAISRAA